MIDLHNKFKPLIKQRVFLIFGNLTISSKLNLVAFRFHSSFCCVEDLIRND